MLTPHAADESRQQGQRRERTLKHLLSGKTAFWLDIKITEGTNTKGETTAFVRAAFDGMTALLGPLHQESYVLVHAVDGDAYGYGGWTQTGRWVAATPG